MEACDTPEMKEIAMALSDELSRLAARTKELEDRAAAAKEKAKADLQQEVKEAREASQADADALAKSIERDTEDVAAWWHDVGRSWNEHLAAVRKSIDEKRAGHDLKSAQRAAGRADDSASYAVAYAYSAVVEAEYAVLDAVLAHMEADEMAAAAPTS
jgi:hypothetical protein